MLDLFYEYPRMSGHVYLVLVAYAIKGFGKLLLVTNLETTFIYPLLVCHRDISILITQVVYVKIISVN